MSSDSNYSEDYEEEYSEESSDDSSSPAKPPAAAASQQSAALSLNEGVVHVSGASNPPLCLTDSQKSAIKKRRAVWNAVSKDNRIVLSSVQSTLLQKRPQSDHDLLLAAMGPYATVLSASCQTGDNLHQQDTQTSFIPTHAEGSQAPQDLMEVLRASSKAYLLPSQRDSKQSSLSAASKKVIQASAPGIKGFSAASETFPAPPTAFPQRQIVSHLAVSKTYQQPVVAVVYFQVTPAQTNDGSILSVECSENTTNSKFLGLNCESVVALWSLKNPSSSISPGAVLMCHSSLICCDLQAVDRSHSETPQQPSHSAATAGFIVVGGCTDGSVCVWDTRSHPHMHCAWQDPADSAAKGSTDKGDRALQQTAVYAPVFSTICPDDSTAGTSPSTVKDQQANSFEFEGFERLEEISQVAIVAEGRSTANSGRSEKYTEASGNFSVLVLTATGVVSLWAVVVSRGVTRTAAGAFLLDRHGASVRLVNLHKVLRHGTPRASMVHEAEAFAPAACLAISPSTPTTFLVGAGTGSVTRGALHAPQPSPQAYHIQDLNPSLSETMHPVHAFCAQPIGSCVVGVAVHPAASEVFLVAYEMGYLAVFVAQRRCAVALLSCPAPLLTAMWLPGRSDRCAAVTTCGHIVVFHITSGDLKAQEDYKLKLPEGAECTSATVSAWGNCGGISDKENATKEAAQTEHEQDVLVIGLSTGACMNHVLSGFQEKSSATLWSADMLVAKLLGA